MHVSTYNITLLLYQEDEIWIDVRKIDGTWFVGGSKRLSEFESNWAAGEPGDNQDKKCAFMSRDQEYANYIMKFVTLLYRDIND